MTPLYNHNGLWQLQDLCERHSLDYSALKRLLDIGDGPKLLFALVEALKLSGTPSNTVLSCFRLDRAGVEAVVETYEEFIESLPKKYQSHAPDASDIYGNATAIGEHLLDTSDICLCRTDFYLD